MARSKDGRVGASSLTNLLNFWTSVTVVTGPAVVVVLVASGEPNSAGITNPLRNR